MNAWMLACWLVGAVPTSGAQAPVLAQADVAAPAAKVQAPAQATASGAHPRKHTRHRKHATAKATPASASPASTARTAPAAEAMAPDVKRLVDRVQKFYEDTKDFEADFTQRYHYAASHRTQVSTGTAKFKKPGLMRWDYVSPSRRTFLLTGERAYMLDPEALTLTKSPVNENQLSAAVTFLLGKGQLADEFQIAKTPCASCKGVLLTLTPKHPDPRFQRILLEVDPNSAQVLKSTVIDPDGSTNEITFRDLKTNVGLTEDQFKLTPPPNTQIIDLTNR